jgi:AraC-like DNA-binding protein
MSRLSQGHCVRTCCKSELSAELLRRHDFGLTEVAERVGYGSASTFSTAFSRHEGQPPRRYPRQVRRVVSADAAAPTSFSS